jgi:hypothetical protein
MFAMSPVARPRMIQVVMPTPAPTVGDKAQGKPVVLSGLTLETLSGTLANSQSWQVSGTVTGTKKTGFATSPLTRPAPAGHGCVSCRNRVVTARDVWPGRAGPAARAAGPWRQAPFLLALPVTAGLALP